ncbi:uncharacterized protein A1O9_00912 [Exophiala aquamarina CBS 119918]|uniref:DUF1365 domain-containing protein n=1 Tax=Exophiala aquamarina CBS 119918 TaxID=1182545 RepID=A0A072PUB0_9EURO|nr:uncharacterized protein A1O9_00912 [Exophiala aquamarina CBS 119918]KEF62938.1 hypothetical protein A1O9_00912 [Exophiala aquamarina CBS 119918]
MAIFALNLKSILQVAPSLVQRPYIFLVVSAIGLPAVWILLHSHAQRQEQGERRCLYLPQGQYLVPKFFECRTTHTRLFPKKHSFEYSYLLVGVPVGWQGAAIPIISSDAPASHGPTPSSKTWFSVHAEDYLERGTHVDGLAGKLKDYLADQGASIDDYPFAYLVTAPRFLGFSFNPVSFWYLYDRAKTLAAMILEVNNTFDERRMYFLPREGTGNAQASTKFAQQWAKDFHVSPFNDRAGSYSLSATDPFESHGDGGAEHEIDNTIVLRSDEGKPKVIARVFSTSPGTLPTTISGLRMMMFLARWWWVGFMTNPRILREARVLWVKGLQVFYRPEVMATSIGRNPTPEENTLEPFFHSWLQQVSNSSRASIKYSPAAGQKQTATIHPEEINDRQQNAAKREALEIRVLTPAWYTELARNPDLRRAFDQFCFKAMPGQAMVHLTDPERFYQILEGVECDGPLSSVSLRSSSYGTLAAWLRGRNKSIPATGNISTGIQIVALDDHARSTADSQQFVDYERACLKILLADRFAVGLTSLLRVYVRLARLGFWIASVVHLNQFIRSSRGYGAWDLCSFSVKVFVLLMMG